MCSYTQVVIVTHRGPVILCQRHMFCSSKVIFLFFLFSFIQLVDFCHYCASLRCFDARKTSVNPLSSTILIGLQLWGIHLATVLVNLSQADLLKGPTFLSEGGLTHSTWTLLADQRICYGETIMSSCRVYISLWFYWMFHRIVVILEAHSAHQLNASKN